MVDIITAAGEPLCFLKFSCTHTHTHTRNTHAIPTQSFSLTHHSFSFSFFSPRPRHFSPEGGIILDKVPDKVAHNTYCIGTEDDVAILGASAVPVYAGEFILSGVLRQHLDFNANTWVQKVNFAFQDMLSTSPLLQKLEHSPPFSLATAQNIISQLARQAGCWRASSSSTSSWRLNWLFWKTKKNKGAKISVWKRKGEKNNKDWHHLSMIISLSGKRKRR